MDSNTARSPESVSGFKNKIQKHKKRKTCKRKYRKLCRQADRNKVNVKIQQQNNHWQRHAKELKHAIAAGAQIFYMGLEAPVKVLRVKPYMRYVLIKHPMFKKEYVPYSTLTAVLPDNTIKTFSE